MWHQVFHRLVSDPSSNLVGDVSGRERCGLIAGRPPHGVLVKRFDYQLAINRPMQAKFTQHPELGELLVSTGNAKLVEHTTNDNYWGDGGDGSGSNMLGRFLMQVRDRITASNGDG